MQDTATPVNHLTIDHLTRLNTPSDPQISHDGARIAFVVKTMNTEKNRYHNHLWMVDNREGGEARQWTFGVGSETKPRWSPDDQYLAFTSGREEKKDQIYRLSAHGGEAERLTDLPHGSVGKMAWSPDGTSIVFTFRPDDEQWTEEAADERKKNKKSAPAREITRLHYRQEGSGFVPPAFYQIHRVEVATRTVTQFTHSDRDINVFCLSPDGLALAFVQNTAEDPDLMPNADGLFAVTLEAFDPMRLNTPEGPKSSIAWSPDGKYIAYRGHDKPEEVWGVTNLHIWLAALDTNVPARDLTQGWDVHFDAAGIGDVTGGGQDGPLWQSDSGAVYTLASERGAINVYRLPLNGPPAKVTDGDHAVLGITMGNGDQIAGVLATPTDAGDIYAINSDGALTRRTTVNAELFAQTPPQAARYFEAPTAVGHGVPCWALFPPDFAENAGPRPTLLYIHGGPHAMYSHMLFHEYQALANLGYVVLFPNPRGSKGYGEGWTGAIKGNWGAPAMADCMAAVDHAVKQGWSDTVKLGVLGGSYGGYLTGWIVGHTDRFAVAVAERGVFNLLSMAGTCDFIWRDHDYFAANTSDDPAEYLRNSPLTYANNVVTPLLILHSEGDLRCPVEQAEQFYAALRRQKKTVTFLRYGAEANHELSRGGPPDLRIDRFHSIVAWLDKYLKPAPAQEGGTP